MISVTTIPSFTVLMGLLYNILVVNTIPPTFGSGVRTSDSVLDCWSTSQAIEPAPGANFITKFI